MLVRIRPNQRAQTERHARRQSLRSAAAQPRPPMCRRRCRILSLRRNLSRIPGFGPIMRGVPGEIHRRRRRQSSIRAPQTSSVCMDAFVVARGEHHREPRRRRRRPLLARFPTRGLRLVRSGAEDMREDPEPSSAMPPLIRRGAAVVRGRFRLRRTVKQPLTVAVAIGFPARDVGRGRTREIERLGFLLRLVVSFSVGRSVFSRLGLGLGLGCE